MRTLCHLPSSTYGRRNAFTLVELLVTMGVLSILMLLLFSFFDQAAKGWNRSEQKIDAYREVRAAFHYLRRDLQSMVVSESLPWVYLQNPVNETSPELEAAIGGDPSDAAQGQAIFFLAAMSSEAQLGQGSSDLCSVGYYLSWGPDWDSAQSPGFAPSQSYKLHRYFKHSDETWLSSGIGLQPFLTDFDPANFISGSPLFIRPTGGLNGDEVIARNVVNFEITPYRTNTTTGAVQTPAPFQSWANFAARNDPNTGAPIPGSGAYVKPDGFIISLVAFNSDTALKLGANQNSWHFQTNSIEAAGTPQLIRENAQVFKMKVAVQ
ncbi:MAG: prepilin-type N-terminal cleavage/methylation domain-containing protein [Verrucomicrobiota bacterium]